VRRVLADARSEAKVDRDDAVTDVERLIERREGSRLLFPTL
jgi:hypothetical protein